MKQGILANLVEQIVKALVDLPERVHLSERLGERTLVLELEVDPSDLGKVIGKQGRTAHAIRTLLVAASTKLRQRAVLEILEGRAVGERVPASEEET